MATTRGTDHDDLAQFGYKQRLDRSLGAFSSFAAGFSYLSIITGFFYLFYFGYGTAGPAFWWLFLIGGIGTFIVALNFAELVAHYPVAGSVYSWAKRIAPWPVAWTAGWTMLVASIVTTAGVALALQVILPQISPTFQFIGDGTGPKGFAQNAVLLGSILLVATTIINAIGVKVMAVINNVGVIVELTMVVGLIVLLGVHAVRGPGVVLETNATGDAYGAGWLGAALIAALFVGYTFIGYDTAGSLAEETTNPRREAPKAILRSVVVAAVGMLLLLLVALMAIGNLSAEELSTVGAPYLVKDVLGNTLGNVFLWGAVISITVCCLAVHAATIRMSFAMARDGGLPFGHRLAHVDPRSRTPILPAVVTGLIAIAILVVNISQPQIVTAITSIAVVLFFLAYLQLSVPLLLRRLRGWPVVGASGVPGVFSLGRWGIPVNVAAVGFQLFMVIDIAWPRRAVYNATGASHWYLQWAGVLFPAIIVGAGIVYHLATQRAGVRIDAAHAVHDATGALREPSFAATEAPLTAGA